MMKKQIALIAAAAIVTFSGCGDDRSHPDDGSGVQIVYKNPTAVIDVNGTEHIKLGENNNIFTYRVDSNLSNPFILSGDRSHDNDENNQSIQSYDWNITSTFSKDCLDINSTGSQSVIKLCDEAFTDGDINITLTVIDDEDIAATTKVIIKIN